MLDDQKLAYPADEKFRKHGIKNVCIHKGLMPSDYQTSVADWRYAAVDDLGKAARPCRGTSRTGWRRSRPSTWSRDRLAAPLAVDDKLTALKAEHEEDGPGRSDTYRGWIGARFA